MNKIMKIILIFVSLIINYAILNAQVIMWQKNFGGLQDESSRYGIQTFDGGYVILYLKIGGNGGTYLLDLDQYGVERWNKKIDSVGTGGYIQQTNDEGFIICGAKSEKGSSEKGSLVKVDRFGNLIWNKSFHVNNQNTQFRKVKIIDSGDLLICGNNSFFPEKALVMKLDSLGNIIWQKILNYPDEAEATDIIINNDKFIYFAGGIRVNNYYMTLFAKMNSEGDFLWFNFIGSQGQGDSQYGNSIVSESNKELLISGPYQHFYSTQAHFTKIDSAGNVIFQNILPQTNFSNNMCRTSNGYYAIAGGFFPLTSDDILFLLVNNAGAVISRKLFNSFGDESDISCSIVETADKGFFISGYTTYMPLNLASNSNLYLIKTDSIGNSPVSIKTIGNLSPASFKLYQNIPNPFNPSTKINYSIPESGIVTIKIYDILGKEIQTLVNELKQAGNYEAEFYGKDLPSGIYFYKLVVSPSNPLKSNNISQTKKMMILK
jgi:hypothetical protein